MIINITFFANENIKTITLNDLIEYSINNSYDYTFKLNEIQYFKNHLNGYFLLLPSINFSTSQNFGILFSKCRDKCK